MTTLFNWQDFNNDIHIGGTKVYSQYHYANNESRSDYYKRWYAANRDKQINAVKARQAAFKN